MGAICCPLLCDCSLCFFLLIAPREGRDYQPSNRPENFVFPSGFSLQYQYNSEDTSHGLWNS